MEERQLMPFHNAREQETELFNSFDLYTCWIFETLQFKIARAILLDVILFQELQIIKKFLSSILQRKLKTL